MSGPDPVGTCPRCGAVWWPGDERKQTYEEAETALEAEPEPSDKELEEEVREQMAEADLAALEAESEVTHFNDRQTSPLKGLSATEASRR